MVVIIGLPKVQQALGSNANTLDAIEISVTSDGILSLNSEIHTVQDRHTSKDKARSKIQQKNKIREDLLNVIQSREDLVNRGRVGNRRRKRYENSNFLNLPNYQPPLPLDWEVYPTHPVYHDVPYYLAPLWDSKFQQISEERIRSKSSLPPHGKVSHDLKLTLKKSKGARYILQQLEDRIRAFIQLQNEKQVAGASYPFREEVDTEDEEIVFIGRDSDGRGITMSDEAGRTSAKNLQTEKLIFETKPPNGSGFMRWLIYELAEYYGLNTYRESPNGDKSCVQIILVGFWDQEKGNCSNHLKRSQMDDGVILMPRPLLDLI
ncbi:putative uv-damaged dna-binding protein [Erysiphe necator]|uniref:Putative uv-damaged dna-binding protein n=1 Tax=Uncinula necator TaxID=52586 RepID=A0A0B1PC88_UNCNE|nr:putative uv-damaged dna-binding protein [Erysiphe necator]